MSGTDFPGEVEAEDCCLVLFLMCFLTIEGHTTPYYLLWYQFYEQKIKVSTLSFLLFPHLSLPNPGKNLETAQFICDTKIGEH